MKDFTTVQISKKTWEQLDILKRNWFMTFDGVISKLLEDLKKSDPEAFKTATGMSESAKAFFRSL